jgi:hypothetical protein
MALLTASRNTPELNFAGALNRFVGVEAATSVYVGGMTALDANGYAVPAQVFGATPLNALRILGVVTKVYAGGDMPVGVNANNLTTAAAQFPPNLSNLGSAGAISVYARRGIFGMDNDGSLAATNIGQLCFANDDHTVSLSDGSGATAVPNTFSFTMPASTAAQIKVLFPYIVPGSLNAYSATGGGGTHYVEGTDYAVDYQGGLFMGLSGGAIAAASTVFISYNYGKPTKVVAGTVVTVETNLVYVDFTQQALPAAQAANLVN